MGHLSIEHLIVGGGDHQHTAVEIALPITALTHLATALLNQSPQRIIDQRRDHPQAGASLGQQPRLAQSDLAATDHQHLATMQIVKQGKKVHGQPRGKYRLNSESR
ncbi:hypothetical protein D3C78_1259430 [compost metagenome]